MTAARPIVSVLVVLGLAAGGYLGVSELRERRPRPVPRERPDPGPVPVTTRELEARDVPLEVEAYGTLAAKRRARLAPEIAGRIERRLETWRPGLRIARGTELVRIDDTALRLALDEADAAVREAEAALAAARLSVERASAELEPVRERHAIAARDLERGQELLTEGIASASGLDALRAAERAAEVQVRQVTSRLESARAEVAVRRESLARAESARAVAQDRLERSSIRAPFDGFLVGRAPDVGSYVGPNAVVCELVDLSELQLVARVAEIELAGLAEGRPAVVTTPSQPGRRYEARVHAVGVDADPSARSVAVEVAVANPVPVDNGHPGRPALVAGQFARARIDVGSHDSVLTIERKEIVWRAGRPVAFVLDASDPTAPVARARELELGRAVREGFVVRAGLEPGDTLIQAPLDRMIDGVACRVTVPSEGDG